MIDLSEVEGFQWDAGNNRKNVDKHGVGQGEAELLVVAGPHHSQREPRFHALGRTDDGRLLHIMFTLRAHGRLIRVISARDMHRKERLRYGQEA